jgi:hypothetical protein
MTTVVDRYIEVAMTGIPNPSRHDVEGEMRAMIAEMIDARIEQGESLKAAVSRALEGLGDPLQLARRYDDREQYLIGPGVYHDYVHMLRNLLVWLVPLIAAIVYADNVLRSDSDTGTALIESVFASIGTTLLFTVQIVFWVTVGFAIHERMQPETDAADVAWTIDNLPEVAPSRQITIGDAIWGFASTALLAIILVLQHQRGVDAFMQIDDSVRNPDYPEGTVVPFLNPEIPDGFAYLALGIVVVTAVFEIMKYAVGHWTARLATAEIALDVAWIAATVFAALRWGLVNQEIADVWSGGAAEWLVGDGFERLLIVGVILVSGWSAWEAIAGYRSRHGVARAEASRAW